MQIKNIYKAITDWFSNGINIVKQIRIDSKYRKRFSQTIESQCYDPRSAFVKMGLKPGDDGESLIQVVSVPEEVQLNGQDFLIQDIHTVGKKESCIFRMIFPCKVIYFTPSAKEPFCIKSIKLPEIHLHIEK